MATKARQPMRPQNKCSHCGYKWHPRGHNLSNKCPSCGKGAVKLAGPGLIASLIIMAVMGYFNYQGSTSTNTANTLSYVQPPSSNVASNSVQLIKARRIYSDTEIDVMENEKQYHGDDPIVRKRLGLPSRETHQLIQ